MKRRDNSKIKKIFKNKNGITLIALVVTMIVILILARNKYICNYRKSFNNKSSTEMQKNNLRFQKKKK